MTSELSAESTEAVEQDVVNLFANIRRSLSERANRPGQGYELPDEVVDYLAKCYHYVLMYENAARDFYELPSAGGLPRWVRDHTYR